MANIKIANHRIMSDTHGWVVAEEKERQSGEQAGTRYLTNKKYTPSLRSALLLLQDKWLRSSDAESIEDVLDEIDRFRAQLAGAFAVTVVEPEP